MEIRDNERLDIINADLSLIQRTDGLTYGTDALLLAAFAKSKPNGRAAELGGGTGVVSLLCAAREKFKHIDIFEIQDDFAELCSRNAALNNFSDRITVQAKDIRYTSQSDTGGEVDAVLSNPPYMRAGSGIKNDTLAKSIARHELCGGISDFCAAAARLLKHGGSFYCVWRPDRLPDLLCALRESKLEPKKLTFVCPEAAKAPSLLLCLARKGGSPSLEVTAPIIIYESGTRSYTSQMESIFENGAI